MQESPRKGPENVPMVQNIPRFLKALPSHPRSRPDRPSELPKAAWKTAPKILKVSYLPKAVGLLLLLPLVARAAPSWKPYTNPEQTFSVNFPGKPRVTRTQTSSPLGRVETVVYSSAHARGNCSVACTQLPAAAVQFASGQVMSDAKAGLLQDAGARELSWVDLANGGKELAYQNPTQQGWCQFYLVGNRLYVLDARMKPKTDRNQWVVPFFASFRGN